MNWSFQSFQSAVGDPTQTSRVCPTHKIPSSQTRLPVTSMGAHLVSVGVAALDVYLTGSHPPSLVFCMRTAPSPLWLASVMTLISALGCSSPVPQYHLQGSCNWHQNIPRLEAGGLWVVTCLTDPAQSHKQSWSFPLCFSLQICSWGRAYG